MTGLEAQLRESLFGQHLVLDIVPKLIKGHRKDKNPQKPLVLSLHGGTGTGKNYVAGIIAQHLYPKGFESSFVHRILSSHEFPDKELVSHYKAKIKDMLLNSIKKCQNSLFIIDEVDKMPPGLVDVLKPYLDYNNKVDGYDYRKAIFIFMGNSGVEEINDFTNTYFSIGRMREEITMKAMNKLLQSVSYSTGGLSAAQIVDQHLVDYYIPFLPLEKKHVKMCAAIELKKLGRHPSEEDLNAVAKELEYYPKAYEIFSVSGCKNVQRTVQVLF